MTSIFIMVYVYKHESLKDMIHIYKFKEIINFRKMKNQWLWFLISETHIYSFVYVVKGLCTRLCMKQKYIMYCNIFWCIHTSMYTLMYTLLCITFPIHKNIISEYIFKLFKKYIFKRYISNEEFHFHSERIIYFFS